MVAIASSSSSSSEEHGNEEVQDGRMARQIVWNAVDIDFPKTNLMCASLSQKVWTLLLALPSKDHVEGVQDMEERHCILLPGISLEDKWKKRKRKR